MPSHPFKIFFRHPLIDSKQKTDKKGQTEYSYLLKYYPKYYSKIHLEKINSAIAVKVKGLKKLFHFSANLNENQRNDLASNLLQKVRKDVKSIVKIFRDNEEAVKWYGSGFKEVKWLSGIERIELPGYFLRDPFQSPDERPRNSKEEVNRIFRYLTHARSIKKIDLSVSQQMSEFLAKKLSRTKKLREKICETKARIFCFESLNVPGLKDKDSMIAKQLGHLTIDKVEGENLEEFGEILGALEGLQSLRISLIKSAKVYETPISELQEMSASLFAAIEGLLNLERLSLKFSGGIIGWVNSFALPKSLKTLRLCFSAGNSIFAALAAQKDGLQKSVVLKNFCSKIEQLPLLETLELILSPLLYDDPEDVLDFAALLLKRIPRLTSLKLDLPSFPVETYNKGRVLDFSCIFEAIQHLMPGLKELKIAFPEFLRPVTFDLDSQCSFAKIEKIEISGNISPNIDVQQALMNLFGGSENKERKLEMRQIFVKSKEELEKLLGNIQGIGGSIELNAKIKLHINLKDDQMLTALMDFFKSGTYIQGLRIRTVTGPDRKSLTWLKF